MDRVIGRSQNDLGNFALRFAQLFQLRLDFFQHIHDVKRLTGNDDFRSERNRNAVLSDITPVCCVNDKSR
ncbi:hypothetical protein E4555_06380 [Escherichia coli]|nr:hypothetical protein [Escherichia coli]